MRTNANARLCGLLVTVSSLGFLHSGVARANPETAQSSGLPQAARAQPVESRPVQIDNATARHFENAFRSVSDQAHVLIVSEGTPLHASLTDDEVADLQRHLPLGSTAADAVRAIADAYDYSVEQPNPRTFLLCKRYTNPADLPCVTYDEITHSLRSVLQMIDAFSPETAPPTYKTIDQLYDSLTPEQAKQAKSTIAFKDLSPQQQELALAVLKRLTTENRVENLRQLSKTLAVVDRRSTVFEWVDAKSADQSQTKAFGFEGEFSPDNSMVGLPVAFPFKLIGGQSYISLLDQGSAGSYARTPDIGSPTVPAHAEASIADPTLPTPVDQNLAAGMLANRLSSTMTLREAVQAVTHSSSDSVDEAVSEKPVNVFGILYAGGARPFVEALADVYGLQAVGDANQGVSLRLPEPRISGYPSQTLAEITRLIPRPRARSFVGANGTSGKNELYFSAVRRLIALAEPAVPTANSPPVQVDTMGPEAKRLIALALLTGEPLRQLLALESYVPSEGLMHPGTLLICISRDIDGGTPYMNLAFRHIAADGISINDDVVGCSVIIAPGKTFSGRVQ